MAVPELTRNAIDVLPEGELERKLARGRPLRVKLGIDVTAPDVHIGHAIPLQRMAAFQREGHKGVFIVGDYTTRIGDPSGRSSERPILSDEEIDANARLYLEQAKMILRDDPELMQAFGLEPQVVLTTPLLLSWDGEKMSSSVGNNVPLTAAPEEMFGRTMRIPDSQLEEWWTLVAEQPVPQGE